MAEKQSNKVVPDNDVFLEMSATYLIDEAAKPGELFNDADVLSKCADDIINQVAIELANEGSDLAANPHIAASMLFGARYLAQQARNVEVSARVRSDVTAAKG